AKLHLVFFEGDDPASLRALPGGTFRNFHRQGGWILRGVELVLDHEISLVPLQRNRLFVDYDRSLLEIVVVHFLAFAYAVHVGVSADQVGWIELGLVLRVIRAGRGQHRDQDGRTEQGFSAHDLLLVEKPSCFHGPGSCDWWSKNTSGRSRTQRKNE